MNFDDREACLQWFESDKVNDKEMLVHLVLSAWEAALQWRDSQVGEPVAYYTCKGNWPRVDLAINDNVHGYEIPLYAAPPTAQINQQLVEALELADAALEGANMNTGVVYKKVKAALAAAKETK